MKYYSYENFKNDTNLLVRQTKKFEPHTIVTILRGGLTLAHAMAEGLNIRDVKAIRSELYDKTSKREQITIFGDCSFKNNTNVLVVDDIADSGQTMQSIMKYLQNNNPHTNFKSATIFYKKTSVYEPDFWINEADEWIDFFWESDFI